MDDESAKIHEDKGKYDDMDPFTFMLLINKDFYSSVSTLVIVSVVTSHTRFF